MRKHVIMLLVVALGLFGAGCDDTMGGLEQDAEEGVEEVEEQLDELQDS